MWRLAWRETLSRRAIYFDNIDRICKTKYRLSNMALDKEILKGDSRMKAILNFLKGWNNTTNNNAEDLVAKVCHNFFLLLIIRFFSSVTTFCVALCIIVSITCPWSLTKPLWYSVLPAFISPVIFCYLFHLSKSVDWHLKHQLPEFKTIREFTKWIQQPTPTSFGSHRPRPLWQSALCDCAYLFSLGFYKP
jgi:hypothetical protein